MKTQVGCYNPLLTASLKTKKVTFMLGTQLSKQ